MDIFGTLSSNGIEYTLVEHPPVMNCEEARALVPELGGIACKNLFLRDKKGKRHVLVVLPEQKSADLNALGKMLGYDRLSFGSPDRLLTHLGITPGAVSLLALINDSSCSVELIIDEDIWAADAVDCHPLVNTATICLSHEGLEKFLGITGHKPVVVAVPS